MENPDYIIEMLYNMILDIKEDDTPLKKFLKKLFNISILILTIVITVLIIWIFIVKNF